MLRYTIFAVGLGLVLPLLSSVIADWIITKLGEVIENLDNRSSSSIVGYCAENLYEVHESIRTNCENIIWYANIKNIAWYSGVAFVGLILIYFLSSIICGKRRNLVALIFPTLVRFSIFAVSLLMVIQGVLTGYLALKGVHYSIEQVNLALLMIAVSIYATVGGLQLLYQEFKLKPRVIDDELGIRVSHIDCPSLWRFVERIAVKLGSKIPDNIVLGIEPQFFVTSGDIDIYSDKLEKIRGETLFLSLPLMRLLKVEELASVIGHELGHFRTNDTRYSLYFAPVFTGLGKSIESLTYADWKIKLACLPATVVLKTMLKILERNESKISQIREYEADICGVAVSSKNDFASSLAKIAIYQTHWVSEFKDEIVHRLNQGKITHNLCEVFEDSAKYDISHTEIEELIHEFLPTQLTHPTDTHPSIVDRFKKIDFEIRDLSLEDLIDTDDSSDGLIGDDVLEYEQMLSSAEQRELYEKGIACLPDVENDEHTSAFLKITYQAVSAMIRADKKIEPSEIKTAEEIGRKLISDFDKFKFRSYCNEKYILPSFANTIQVFSRELSTEELQIIYDYLEEVAHADEDISPEEQDLLYIARKEFGLPIDKPLSIKLSSSSHIQGK